MQPPHVMLLCTHLAEYAAEPRSARRSLTVWRANRALAAVRASRALSRSVFVVSKCSSELWPSVAPSSKWATRELYANQSGMKNVMRIVIATLVLAIAAGAWAKPTPSAKGTKLPSWLADDDCFRKDEGGAGEQEETIVPERTGLRFPYERDEEGEPIPGNAPIYEAAFVAPDFLELRIDALNGLGYPSEATVEVDVCGFEETCIVAYGDFGIAGDGGPIAPGERRQVRVELEEPLDYGWYRVSFTLFDGFGRMVDLWVGEPVLVGQYDLRIGDLCIPGQESADNSGGAPISEVDGVTFSMDAANLGDAHSAAYAVFAIDGGGEYTCGIELYTPITRVDAGTEAVPLSVNWPDAKPGRHIVTVLLKDVDGNVVAEDRGITFRLK